MAELWPASFPQKFLVGSYQQGFGDGRLRSQNDVGPATMRRRSSATPDPLSGQMAFSTVQLDALKVFVKTTTAGGTLVIDFPRQDGAGRILVRFADRLPTWTWLAPDKWLVDFKFEILP